MLGIKPWSSARAVSSLNCWAISPAPLPFKKIFNLIMKSIGTPYFRPRIQSLAVCFGKTVQHFWRQWTSKLHRPSFSHQCRSPVWGNPRVVFISHLQHVIPKTSPRTKSPDVESIVALLKGHFLRSSMLQISPLALHPGHKKRCFPQTTLIWG